MFTVEQLASKPSIWRTITPFEKSFLRSVRKGPEENATADRALENWDLVSESSFYMATRQFSEGDALEHALSKVSGLKGSHSLPLSEKEVDVARELGIHIEEFVYRDPAAEIDWMPRVPGLGGLAPSEADVIVDQKLIEIKNVNRRFSPRDLRQILLYSAALTISGRDISEVCLANFRRIRFFNVELHSLAVQVSGRSWIELRAEIEWLLLELSPPSID